MSDLSEELECREEFELLRSFVTELLGFMEGLLREGLLKSFRLIKIVFLGLAKGFFLDCWQVRLTTKV